MDPRLLKILKMEFDMKEEISIISTDPLDLTFLMKMYKLEGFDDLKVPPYTPAPVKEMMTDEDIFYPDPADRKFFSTIHT